MVSERNKEKLAEKKQSAQLEKKESSEQRKMARSGVAGWGKRIREKETAEKREKGKKEELQGGRKGSDAFRLVL